MAASGLAWLRALPTKAMMGTGAPRRLRLHHSHRLLRLPLPQRQAAALPLPRLSLCAASLGCRTAA